MEIQCVQLNRYSMIQKQGDYYLFSEGDNTNKQTSPPTNHEDHIAHEPIAVYATQGSCKERIQAMRERFEQIKRQKQQYLERNSKAATQSIFDKIKAQEHQSPVENLGLIEIYIPDEILRLDHRLAAIEQKLNLNEAFRKAADQKGTLIQRIRLLHQKLLKVLEKSSEIIIANIKNYCSSLDDKEEMLKIVFLRDAINKTQGMREEIAVLEAYLESLSQVQTKIRSIEPLKKTVDNHNQILTKRSQLSEKIRVLFGKMKTQYLQLSSEIETLSV